MDINLLQGTCYYNEDRSSFYSGDWVKGKKHGWGTMVYESGNRYEGVQAWGYASGRWFWEKTR